MSLLLDGISLSVVFTISALYEDVKLFVLPLLLISPNTFLADSGLFPSGIEEISLLLDGVLFSIVSDISALCNVVKSFVSPLLLISANGFLAGLGLGRRAFSGGGRSSSSDLDKSIVMTSFPSTKSLGGASSSSDVM